MHDGGVLTERGAEQTHLPIQGILEGDWCESTT